MAEARDCLRWKQADDALQDSMPVRNIVAFCSDLRSVPRFEEVEREQGNKHDGKEPEGEFRSSSNSIYDYWPAAHNGLIDQHLPAGALSAVAILKFKLSVSQLENADVGFASWAQQLTPRAGCARYIRRCCRYTTRKPDPSNCRSRSADRGQTVRAFRKRATVPCGDRT